MFGDVPVVWLDAGGAFGDNTPVGDMQNHTMLDGMSRIGYAAANVAERELAVGAQKFLEFAAKAKFPYVSANVVTDPGGKPFVQPYVIHEIEVRGPADAKAKRLRIGITGLVRSRKEFLGSTAQGQNLLSAPPLEALRRWLPEMRKKSDLTVVLVSMRYEEALEVAQAAEELGLPLDFILGGSADFVSRDEASLLSSTKIVYAGEQGRRLGEVRVFLDDKRRPARSVFDAIWLTRDYPGDPEIESMVQSTLADINDWHREHQVSGSPLTPVIIGAAYTGLERCKTCHEKAYEVYQRSAHAHALQTLVRDQQVYNPECLKCHTTGFQEPTGYLTLTNTPHLANVGCESCHGASSTHPDSVVAGFGRGGMKACLPCHNRENSPEFNFTAYWERIKH